VSVHCGGRPHSSSRVVDCHSVEELGFQLLDRRGKALLREVQCEGLGFCVPWGNRASVVSCKVADYSFPPLSGESGIFALWQGIKGSLAVRDSGEC
jgi:hypothetical protein